MHLISLEGKAFPRTAWLGEEDAHMGCEWAETCLFDKAPGDGFLGRVACIPSTFYIIISYSSEVDGDD